jgi:hypothetical protein
MDSSNKTQFKMETFRIWAQVAWMDWYWTSDGHHRAGHHDHHFPSKHQQHCSIFILDKYMRRKGHVHTHTHMHTHTHTQTQTHTHQRGSCISSSLLVDILLFDFSGWCLFAYLSATVNLM